MLKQLDRARHSLRFPGTKKLLRNSSVIAADCTAVWSKSPVRGLLSRAQDECSVTSRELTLLELSELSGERMVTVLPCRGEILQVGERKDFEDPGLVMVTSAYRPSPMTDTR